jgi:tetratricopeptide (TPR) repeat protein
MAENPRIEELRRRVQMDPASIAFAALAEEYRRQGRHEEAIQTCRGGLQRHPSYLSARVTLGRALIEVGDYEGAREELEVVLSAAPENLAAIRGLALIHERLGHSTEMDPHLAAVMHAEAERAEAARAAAPPPPPPPPLAPAPRAPEPVFFDVEEMAEHEPESNEPHPALVATLSRLERFLAGIQTARHA